MSGPAGIGLAQVLYNPTGPLSTAFLLRGPTFGGDGVAIWPQLLAEIDRRCRRHRSVTLGIEPRQPLPALPDRDRCVLIETADRFSPIRTVVVPLLADEALLAQMHGGTRHKIRRAERLEVSATVVRPTPEHLAQAYALLTETAARQGFKANSREHYASVFDLFGDDAALVLATVADAPVATIIVARFGPEAIYLHGGSATHQPVRGATALVQFTAMRWASAQGAARYDLWGIDAARPRPQDHAIDRSRGTDCHGDNGLCRFKIGFGGEVAVLPERVERHYHPHLLRVRSQLRRWRARFAGTR